MLQCRNGKRTIPAALKVAVDMAREGLITKEEAVTRIEAAQLDQILHPTIDPAAVRKVITTGLPASPGAACGQIVFSPDDAEKLKAQGKTVILVRNETSPEDIHGMHAAAGILTARGGMTSHAAVVARGMGRPCVSGASALRINHETRTLSAGESRSRRRHHHHRRLDRPGHRGRGADAPAGADRRLRHADGVGRQPAAHEGPHQCRHAGATPPRPANSAPKASASAAPSTCSSRPTGSCRARDDPGRDQEGRRAALAKILPMQKQDFIELFEIMEGLPVTIRLLDPPLHEFLPHDEAEIAELAQTLSMDGAALRAPLDQLNEYNPMLGHRGCRLAITYPEIAEMQVRAIFEAAFAVSKSTGEAVIPEVMIPLVATKAEFDILKTVIDKVAKEVQAASGALG